MTTTEYLQREIRRAELSIRRAERKPNTPPEELRGLHEKLEHMQEALKTVNEHWQRVHEQRGWTAGEPLTLEQLRGMDKPTPVWMEADKKTIEGWGGYWCLCQRGHILTPGMVSMYADKMDGATFYSYPPAHIDLEKWTAEWVDNDQGEGMMCKCSKCGYPVSYFWGKTEFCPGCGRAMTPEALAELERRCLG
jgi:hypothetical protein